ncbi:ubiquitin carboxyl-terminal hydrolase 2-like isoform X2 [Cynara cardunculus var. scolymus]|uniref:ubiquitin carboxyl-terminal hydrolase 2-like isoform X2 n=1 Tax=Cynara cardunculus var. scolymus TaxID=59895 RepID=UPI000D62E7CD|nr:ubiquitin carboxyl-terminal hydrolase 2-like isoform X2 [Cynara cardunculus var. scolymus]
MGKKVKKAARNAQKEKQSRVSSPKTVSQEIVPASDTVVDGVSVTKETKSCPHLDKGINLEKFSLKMASLESLKCDDCREGVADRRTKKGKGKNGKNKGSGSKSESLSIWVCLECGHFSCGGVGFPTTPQSHAARHAKQNRHPLVFQFANHNLRWCFLCNTLIPVQSSDQNGEQKDVLSEFVKILKTRSSSETRVDVEDTWFGSGSVISGIKSVNTLPSCSETRGGYMVRGLVNLGNTCFFNSVLQNLLAMDKLRDYFLRLEGSVGPLTVSLKKLFVETSPSTVVRNVINPRSFFGCVCAKAPQFRGYQQHDSHELLRCLLDGLCTEESGVRKRSVEGNTAPEHALTFVDTIFGGQISSTVRCLECGHASVVYEPYLDLSLPLPTKRSPSKKAPSVSRSKKPKLPPKRQSKRLSKTKKASDASVAHSVSNISVSDESSGPVKSTEACAETNVAPSGDSTRPESAVLDGTGDTNDSSLQKLIVLQGNGRKQIKDSRIKESVISSDNLVQPDYVEQVTLSNNHEKATVNSSNISPLLDYSEPTMVSNDRDTAAHLGDVSVTEHTSEKELVQDELLQSTVEANEQVDSTDSVETPPLPDEPSWLDYLEPSTSTVHDMASHNQEPSVIQDSGNRNGISWEDEPLLKVRESEVLLLPYKEVTSTSGGDEITLSSVTTKQESSDFDGFGGLFDEPEVAAGPTVNPLSNGVEGSGFMATSNSESDPDEVDHTDSPVSVEKCLAYFTSSELLTKTEHAWQCEQCSKSLLEQRMRLKNKLQKPVPNGGENKISSASSDSGIEHLLPNGVRNLDNRSTEDAVLGESDENSVLHNGKSENSQVASEHEEGKIVVNSSNVEPPQHSVTALSKDHCSDQDTESCSINKPTNKCKNENVQQRESKLLARQQELDSSEDEEVDSKGVKVARDASKRILISRAPPVLTIHLKRFCQDARGRLSKLSGHVNFRDTIDLKPYMDLSCCRDRETYKYQLVGVVEHLGTMRGGHYVAYVKGGAKGDSGAEDNEDHLWYHASDAYVREASLEEVLRCEAYILFYEEIM